MLWWHLTKEILHKLLLEAVGALIECQFPRSALDMVCGKIEVSARADVGIRPYADHEAICVNTLVPAAAGSGEPALRKVGGFCAQTETIRRARCPHRAAAHVSMQFTAKQKRLRRGVEDAAPYKVRTSDLGL